MNVIQTKREVGGRFHGVRQIVRFNWPRYAVAMVVVLLAWLAWHSGRLPDWAVAAVALGVIMSVWWMVSSVGVSHWVYDRSELMSWEWLPRELAQRPRRWLNVHAGLDESTVCLRDFWPEAVGETVDIFAPGEMTEGSIHRAREESGVADRRVDFRALPFADGQFDTAFLLFAVHELRARADPRAFFAELRRVLASGGAAILVEHLRDPANFIAFGPGFLHFHSRRNWLGDLTASGLRVQRELHFTPFVRAFILGKLEKSL